MFNKNGIHLILYIYAVLCCFTSLCNKRMHELAIRKLQSSTNEQLSPQQRTILGYRQWEYRVLKRLLEID